tara:strand:+ start:4684 stop:4935 length:252 start_codon:yes stop_codon:yes gene_type:complete
MNRRTLLKGLFASVALIYQPSVLAVDYFKPKSRKLVAKWSIEMKKELNSYFKLDLEHELTEIMAKDIQRGIDDQFMEDRRRLV